jgi:hypothetical protein
MWQSLSGYLKERKKRKWKCSTYKTKVMDLEEDDLVMQRKDHHSYGRKSDMDLGKTGYN